VRKILIIILSLTNFSLDALPWFPSQSAKKAYDTKDFAKAQEILEKKQVDDPLNPLINYNLGTVYYKQKDYDAAKESFSRAATHFFGKDKNLHEKSLFNLGNSFYKKTLSILPEGWEKEKELDEKIKKEAISEITQSIEAYKKALSINSENEKTKTNKKAAEEILKKLQKKQGQNKQDKKQQDKKNKKKDQDKQKQDKQKKNDQKQQQKQQKQKQPKPISMEQRKVQATLSKLDEHEKKIQKKLLRRKVKKDAKPKNNYQKPW
jgi:hypothetical protein